MVCGSQKAGEVVTVELRDNGGGQLVMRGLASRTEIWYPIGAGIEEKVCAKAFVRTLNNKPDVCLNLGHGQGGSGLPLARTTARNGGKPSLFLEETREGLAVEAILSIQDPEIVSLRAKAEHCDLQMSFCFKCDQDKWSADLTKREILAANLSRGDVAICAFGANEHTELTISERAASSVAERRSFADRLAGRVAGPQFGWRGNSSACEKCGGALNCSNCELGARTYATPVASTATDGRSIVGNPRLDAYRRKALALSPGALPNSSEQYLRRAVSAEERRKANEDFARKARLMQDWRDGISATASARREREERGHR
jgi:Caudovirus prohead serine protease